jgi:hypothetical protein
MPGGRPTKYDSKYCDMVIDHMAKGLSFESFAGVIEVSRDSLYEWAKQHREFSDAKKIGTSKSLLYWEQLGLDGATGNNSNGVYYFSASTWIFSMKNRFRWSDRHELSVEEVKPTIIKRFNSEQVIELGLSGATAEDDQSDEA